MPSPRGMPTPARLRSPPAYPEHFDPLHESRLYAMMHLAIHDALNAIDRRSRPYVIFLPMNPGASAEAAVAAAARDAGSAPHPTPSSRRGASRMASTVSRRTTQTRSPQSRNPAKTQGVELGGRGRVAILALRAADGADTPSWTWVPPGGRTRRVPVHTRLPVRIRPRLGRRDPFVLKDQLAVPPGRHLQGNEQEVHRGLQRGEGARRGRGHHTQRPHRRTDRDRLVLGIESSPLQWNRIARTVSGAEGLDIWENARLFGLLNIAFADGYIGLRHQKPPQLLETGDRHPQPRRPTGTQRPAGNPTWTLWWGPPNPGHDSAHSVEGAQPQGSSTVSSAPTRSAFTHLQLDIARRKVRRHRCDASAPFVQPLQPSR